MDELYREVCTMFSENPKNKEPEDFFGGIQTLIDAYKFATKENEQRRKEEETLKKAQMLKDNGATAKKSRHNTSAEIVAGRLNNEARLNSKSCLGELNRKFSSHENLLNDVDSVNDDRISSEVLTNGHVPINRSSPDASESDQSSSDLSRSFSESNLSHRLNNARAHVHMNGDLHRQPRTDLPVM